MEAGKSHTKASQQCTDSLGTEVKDSSAKFNDEVNKEHFREEKGNTKPGNQSKDSDLSWEKTENIRKKKGKFSVNEVNKEAGACGSRSDFSACPPTHSRGKNLSKGSISKNPLHKDYEVKLKSSGRPSSQVTH